ncbi:hypothetical protein NC653_013777 [Populus alba x Populus x berolinensis]|uniref:(S)-hydroxynitrile lyase n=1 Tax=Populus alba x Populus x berolinensis TaxID=444605 RepID=A0AAD6W314_9ROSI|nr:hypothetical protein NC653_013777 [Populus alba x Populus x berolinensis]
MVEINNQKKHFVLIHGSVAGAWIWYKVKPRLEEAGHRVTALDMAASGANTQKIEEVRTFDQYNEPLMEFMAKLPENEKVVLVGHSLGGLNLAFAMEKFPEKVSLAVFLTAILPDTVHQPSYMLEKFTDDINSNSIKSDGITTLTLVIEEYEGDRPLFAEIGPRDEEWQDTLFSFHGTPEEPHTCVHMGFEFMKCKPFHLSSAEDLALQMLLNRPGSMFVESLSKAKKFTDERYGSVPRVYIVCTEDLMMPASFQRWMIEQNGVKEAMEIPADHMPVFSTPTELCHSILDIKPQHQKNGRGAWIWYKVKPRLEEAGHRVTALDMAASGVNTQKIEEVRTFDLYNEPLMEFMAKLPENEKVVLVGHSLGGLNLAFAMEKFPEKVSLAVFLTAILPDTVHQPSYMLEKFAEIGPKDEEWQDTLFSFHGTPEEPHTCVHMGFEFMKCKPFHLSSAEDLALQMLLNRPGSLFVESLSKAKKFTDERYGSVPRVYIVCTEDLMMLASFQRWMIEQNGVKEVMEIPADHMPVFSTPAELCHSILELARKHA